MQQLPPWLCLSMHLMLLIILFSHLVSLIFTSFYAVMNCLFAVVIISTLERYAFQQSLPSNWVPSIFSEAKIPSGPEIVEAYNVILCRKVSLFFKVEAYTVLKI